MDIKDKFIFVTGVVGRAMGSGKFTGADIQALTDLACQAFENSFGKFAEPAPTHNFTTQTSAAIPSLSLPEGKDFSVWKKDKCLSFNQGFKEAPWEALLEGAKAGDNATIKALNEMASSDPGDPSGRWYKANMRRASRAKAVLLMA